MTQIPSKLDRELRENFVLMSSSNLPTPNLNADRGVKVCFNSSSLNTELKAPIQKPVHVLQKSSIGNGVAFRLGFSRAPSSIDSASGIMTFDPQKSTQYLLPSPPLGVEDLDGPEALVSVEAADGVELAAHDGDADAGAERRHRLHRRPLPHHRVEHLHRAQAVPATGQPAHCVDDAWKKRPKST